MSEKTWTPEPWRQEQDTTLVWGTRNPEGMSSWGLGVPVANARIHETVREAEAMANAARFAACVNACAGIAEPEKAIPALVEALRTLLAGWEYNNSFNGDLDDEGVAEARAALALVQPPSAIQTVRECKLPCIAQAETVLANDPDQEGHIEKEKP